MSTQDPYGLRVKITSSSDLAQKGLLTVTHIHPSSLTICLTSKTAIKELLLLEIGGEHSLEVFQNKQDRQKIVSFSAAVLLEIRTLHRAEFVEHQLNFALKNLDLRAASSVVERTRKRDHLDICQKIHRQQETSSQDAKAFSSIRFLPKTLVDLDFNQIDTTTTWLGTQLPAPFLISAMTGGIEKGRLINLVLAHGCSQSKLPMSVGSQRIALEQPELSEIFALKPCFPDIFLVGNIGISQITLSTFQEDFKRCVDMISADAMSIHCNILQELIQTEGHRDFRGLWKNLELCIRNSEVPVMIKEVGSGMDADTAKRLADIGASSLDVGGRGGISWSVVEGTRSAQRLSQATGQSFKHWGLTTEDSLAHIRATAVGVPLIATGGIRDGLIAAKALRMGAHMVGAGMPFLLSALKDIESFTPEVTELLTHSNSAHTMVSAITSEHLVNTMNEFVEGLKITQMLTACQTIEDLKQAPMIDVSDVGAAYALS